MRLAHCVSVLAVLAASSCSGAERRAPPPPAPLVPAPLAPAPVVEPDVEPALPADVASPPLADEPQISVGEWHERHQALLRAPGRTAARLVVLGDSIADGWCGSRAFGKQWGKLKPLNLALPAEQTQQLLWRIEQGALDGLSPRLVIVSIGIENLAHGASPADTAGGVRAVLDAVREKLPASGVLVLALLPAGQSTADPRRAPIQAVNSQLSQLGRALAAEADRVLVSDVGGVFLEPDGSIPSEVMSDFVHPTALGYEALTVSVSLVAEHLLRASRPH